jgi:hypothetical protein
VSAAPAPRTFYKDVLPILQERCQECHRKGEIAPMPLGTFEETRPWAKAIREAISLKRMPPWFAEPGHVKLARVRSLPQAEVDSILAWVEQGAPKGDPADAPPPRVFAEGWRIGQPDVVLAMAEEFHVPASGDVKYQYIPVATQFTEDKWIQAAEVRAGDRSAVHHILVYVREPESEFVKAPRSGSILETARPDHSKAPPDDGTGALETGGPAGASMMTLYVPGGDYLRFEPGQAMLIKKGSDLIFQIHYTTNGKEKVDRSRIGLIFAKEPPAVRVAFLGLTNRTMRIPAGAPNHRIATKATLPESVRLISILPHMHVRGKGYELRAIYPEGASEVLLKVPRYNFDWQLSYYLDAPKVLPKGTRLESSAYFDNSLNNPANPDPNVEVFWGEQTWEEMNTGFLHIELPLSVSPEDFVRRSLPPRSGASE